MSQETLKLENEAPKNVVRIKYQTTSGYDRLTKPCVFVQTHNGKSYYQQVSGKKLHYIIGRRVINCKIIDNQLMIEQRNGSNCQRHLGEFNGYES